MRTAEPMQAALAPRSVDKVRVIRQSMRCFVFGTIGLAPVVGAGLAVQALRLHKAASAELGESRQLPITYGYGPGLLAVWAAGEWFGAVEGIAACMVILVVQSWRVWRSARSAPLTWNPGRRLLLWGVIFACAGLAMSLWLVAALLWALTKVEPPL